MGNGRTNDKSAIITESNSPVRGSSLCSEIFLFHYCEPSKRPVGPAPLGTPPKSCTSPPARSAMPRSEEHTSELQSLMRTSYAVFCLKTKQQEYTVQHTQHNTFDDDF